MGWIFNIFGTVNVQAGSPGAAQTQDNRRTRTRIGGDSLPRIEAREPEAYIEYDPVYYIPSAPDGR